MSWPRSSARPGPESSKIVRWRESGETTFRPCCVGRRAGSGAARGGANGAQLPLPSLGRRHPDGAIRRGGWSYRRGDSGHPQDDPGAARPREGGGRRRRRDQPPDGPLRRDPDQGEPRRACRRGGGGGARAREAQPDLPVEVECRDLNEVREAVGPAPTGCCWTTWGRSSCERRWRSRGGRATDRSWRLPAASAWRTSAKSPRRGWTTSRSVRSPTRRRRSTSACRSTG